MANLIARNCRVEVQSTIGTPVTIQSISKATEGAVGATGHGFTAGDAVILAATGMTELDGQIVRVSTVATDTFVLEGLDTTNFGTFTAGTATKIATWATLAKAQSLESPAVSADRRDAMVLLDTEKQYVYGAPDTPEITVNGLSDLNSTSVGLIIAAASTNSAIGFRVTFVGQSAVRLFRGLVTQPGESISVDQLVTSGFSITRQRRYMAYAS